VGALFDVTKQLESWLAERGLSNEEIRQGMNLLLGDTWEGMSAPEMIKRLHQSGYSITESMPAFADELEALVRGALKLDAFRNRLI
jgi:hypothetical protein